jgi:hypothetical protein
MSVIGIDWLARLAALIQGRGDYLSIPVQRRDSVADLQPTQDEAERDAEREHRCDRDRQHRDQQASLHSPRSGTSALATITCAGA